MIELIQYSSGNALEGVKPNFEDGRGVSGERLVKNNADLTSTNEVYIDRDIMVLANPEIAQITRLGIALVAAGALSCSTFDCCWSFVSYISINFS